MSWTFLLLVTIFVILIWYNISAMKSCDLIASSSPCYRHQTLEDKVYYIDVIDSKVYVLWQAELQLYNFQKLGIANQLIFVLLHDESTPSQEAVHFHSLCEKVGTTCLLYQNSQTNNHQKYVAINKPYGMYLFTLHHPHIRHLFLLDPDVILKRPLPLDQLVWKVREKERFIHASDSASYLDYRHHHEDKKLTDEQITELCDIVGITLDDWKNNKNCIGAQYLFHRMPWQYFKEVADNCMPLYDKLTEFKTEENTLNAWCAEMLSMLFVAIKWLTNENLQCSKLLEFAWCSDHDDNMYHSCDILHCAGVIGDGHGRFQKTLYTNRAPWQEPDSAFDYVTAKGPHMKYFDLIQEYKKYLSL